MCCVLAWEKNLQEITYEDQFLIVLENILFFLSALICILYVALCEGLDCESAFIYIQ